MLSQALQLMIYGLTGVFVSLTLLYIVVRIMVKILNGETGAE